MINNDTEFIKELESAKLKFESNPNLQTGLLAIKKRFDTIYSIVFNKSDMIYFQKSYSYIRPFTDEFQEAIDYFDSSDGQKLLEIFSYFGYNFKVPETQKKGYNIDPNYKP